MSKLTRALNASRTDKAFAIGLITFGASLLWLLCALLTGNLS